MHNPTLAQDYLTRGGHRVAALQFYLGRECFSDVVREAQEAVELCLKALLRHIKIDPPRIHDVSTVLLEHKKKCPKRLQPHLKRLADISRQLRRDRELAFYGSEDLTPSDFYRKEDADRAISDATWVYETCRLAFR